MSDYEAGSLKWDAASKSVAIRTSFPEVGDLANHAWLVATTGSGAISKTSVDVSAWTDLDLPAQPPPVIEGEVIPEPAK
jgi:hypothetical protein